MSGMLAETGPPAQLTPEPPQRKPRAWGAAPLMVALIAGFYLLREH